MEKSPGVNQIAFSVVDLRRTERWFRVGCGLLAAGGGRAMFRGPLATRIQGLPNVASTCWWLVGRNEWCQLELFQFERPIAKLMPADFRPCDIGYTRIGLWVADFDATLARLEGLGTQPLAPPIGTPGLRRACVRNPDGVFVEIMEDDPLPQRADGDGRDCTVAIRSVTLSVPDLAEGAAYIGQGIGARASGVTLHVPEHEALWGLPGATTRSALFEAGDVLVEVVQYLDPVGKPRPEGYRISDQGILNIAFGARNKPDHMDIYRRAVAFGARPNYRPVHLLDMGVVYVNDRHGFSIEILWVKPGRADRAWGFLPMPVEQRPEPDNLRVRDSVRIDAPIERVWAAVTHHDAMANWIGFDPVTRTAQGTPDPDGYGSERTMKGPVGTVVEQVVATNPRQSLRYRVVRGSPLICHQGEIRLSSTGSGTDVDWTIRFRPRFPGAGWLLQRVMRRMLHQILHTLKPYVEAL